MKSNNLDDILFEQITAELEGWGRPDPEPAGDHVLGGDATASADQAPETSR